MIMCDNLYSSHWGIILELFTLFICRCICRKIGGKRDCLGITGCRPSVCLHMTAFLFLGLTHLAVCNIWLELFPNLVLFAIAIAVVCLLLIKQFVVDIVQFTIFQL